jgi:hypothetical protein
MCYVYFMKNKILSDTELLDKTQIAAKIEKTATFELLQYLVEVDERRAYATLACSSLFEYVVKILGYSEMQASERVNSVRLMRAIPEVENKIKSGELSMSTASQVQRFLRQEKKVGNAVSQAKAFEIVETCAGQSKREVEKSLFAMASDEAKFSDERIKEINSEYTELKFMVSETTFKKLQEVKNLIGNDSLQNIFDLALDALLTQTKKKKGMDLCSIKNKSKSKNNDDTASLSSFEAKSESGTKGEHDAKTKSLCGTETNFILIPTFPGKEKTRSRYIPMSVKRIIIARSGNQCEFFDQKTNQRCQSRYHLQFDHHPKPFAKGGQHQPENLRHACFQHNQKAAMQGDFIVEHNLRRY